MLRRGKKKDWLRTERKVQRSNKSLRLLYLCGESIQEGRWWIYVGRWIYFGKSLPEESVKIFGQKKLFLFSDASRCEFS